MVCVCNGPTWFDSFGITNTARKHKAVLESDVLLAALKYDLNFYTNGWGPLGIILCADRILTKQSGASSTRRVSVATSGQGRSAIV